METEMTNELKANDQPEAKDEIILKFGGIKGGNFKNNPIALKTWDEISEADQNNDEELVKTLTCRLIDEFNGSVWNWWENRKFENKQEAKDYILHYEKS